MFRHPKALSEIRKNARDAREPGIKPRRMGKKAPPTAWSDKPVAARGEKSWKSFCLTQYK